MLRVDARAQLGDFSLDATLAAEPGRCLVLTGPSGAGKSTILRIVAGLQRPEAGTVRCGEDVWFDAGARIDLPPERRRCGFVFQEYALFEHLTAWQNVAYGLRHLPRGERRARAEELLDRFGLSARAQARPRTLSGGERQRVALARALGREPRVLLLDEPLSALDPQTRASAGRELAGVLREADVPAILVTHQFSEAAVLGDRVAVVDGGRVVQVGTPAELAARPASAFVADLTGAIVLTGEVRGRDAGLTRVVLDGGGELVSTAEATGRVAASLFPWEVVIEPVDRGGGAGGSMQNRLVATVTSVTAVGGRVRLGLAAGQALVAEVSEAAVASMGLAPGVQVAATWKAAATRLVAV